MIPETPKESELRELASFAQVKASGPILSGLQPE